MSQQSRSTSAPSASWQFCNDYRRGYARCGERHFCFVDDLDCLGSAYIYHWNTALAGTVDADIGEVLRTTGFSASPGILRAFAVIPSIALPVYIGITFWMLVAFVVAIRQALDFTSLPRAFAVCFLGWLIYAVLFLGFVRVAL